MKLQKYIYVSLIVVCSALIAVYGAKLVKRASGNKDAGGAKTTCSLAKEIVDVGDVPQGVPVSGVFTLKNTGSKNLLIGNVTPDCHCTVAEWDKNPVPPGQETYIKASYDSKAPGVFQKLVKVEANVEDTPIVLVLRGNVVAGN